MDAESLATVDSFFKAAPFGDVAVKIAGENAVINLPANLENVASHVSWNTPVQGGMKMESLEMSHLLGGGADIDLSSITQGEPVNSGPQLGGPNFIARKPSGPGFS